MGVSLATRKYWPARTREGGCLRWEPVPAGQDLSCSLCDSLRVDMFLVVEPRRGLTRAGRGCECVRAGKRSLRGLARWPGAGAGSSAAFRACKTRHLLQREKCAVGRERRFCLWSGRHPKAPPGGRSRVRAHPGSDRVTAWLTGRRNS
ncbi:TPA_asm: MC014R [Molluscum contagiosum virus]|uniref:MC014R n=1 Tax=Molluscum contagiosum virus TaxID=10279 RepID=A0A858A074_9POXV|nr:MC014 [Molluscum contagiosum virus subtype 1]QHW16747.1 MC014R [Molluscum contagiosum virus]QHW16929.1 MC014R [Molluscum contagiosum virus]QHW17111.1 MC014R [Molluscum contagiosum virus]DBA37803.1 TPA_asm: MC014R [Molluscum contagiosum virus]